MRFQYCFKTSNPAPYRRCTVQAQAGPTTPRPRAAALTLPNKGKVADLPPARPTARRHRSVFMSGVIGSAAALAVAGCASLNADLTKVFRIEPVLSVTHAISSSPAYYTLGRYHDAEQAWDKAIDAYRKSVIIDTQHIEAYNALGVALARSGRLAEAEATLRQATAIAPDRAHVRSNLGYVLLLAGKPAAAATELALAVKQDPGNSTATANLQLATAQAVAQATTQVAATRTPVVVAETGAALVPAQTAARTADQTAAPIAAPTPTPVVEQPSLPMAPVIAKASTLDVPITPYVPAQPAAAMPTASTAFAAPPQDLPVSLSRLEVSNGNGVTGLAARVGRWLSTAGLRNARLTNQRPYVQATTLIEYRSGHELNAQRVARSLPISATTAAAPSPGLASDVRVLLGRDWPLSAACMDDKSCRPVVTALAAASVR